MSTIESEHYAQTRQRLAADPIVQNMAIGLQGVPRDQLTHDDGGPRFEFMQAANHEYENRGGTDGARHIGAVAEALLQLLDFIESKGN
ncbi:hypothetical protein ORI20_13995 [Mycobacterium sp. CVI_P3]|uniref:Uncharacterized protein n=1 Tax=Mycobacterium pinniadriaticum TaxID=2994102 RepID=A0ABT3SE77_9MYCO|nr:hypothetical protein [Mycobacterium pinniadriaticum]MCX2931392.1 hypothetical protein [Mycobacterium pinniadriaticum]MCX2937816.1 hypothetical protein [Mycobacterium pinniadriaticum]